MGYKCSDDKTKDFQYIFKPINKEEMENYMWNMSFQHQAKDWSTVLVLSFYDLGIIRFKNIFYANHVIIS